MKSWTLTLATFAALVVTATAHAQAAEPAQYAAAEDMPTAPAAPAVDEGMPSAVAVAADPKLDEVAVADSPWSIETGLKPAAIEQTTPQADAEPEIGLEAAEAAVPTAELTPDSDASVVLESVVAPESSLETASLVEADSALEPLAVPAAPASAAVQSGAKAVDARGTRGRIHVVTRGDTLWDIAAAYLRTPWVWPSIWQDNRDIENPHRIYPGDHIWISETEMRKVTPDEAAQMIAAQTGVPEPGVEPVEQLEELPMLGGLAAMEEPAPMELAPARRVLQRTSIPGVADMSFVSEDRLAAATSIVDSVSPRTWLLEADLVVLGLGEGETTIGARYDVFRDAVPVRDPTTTALLGYHVEVLGWIEVTAIHGDSSSALIRMSKSEMGRGDRVIEREEVPVEFSLAPAPPDLAARIVFTPMRRTQMTQLDYVYLDRGAIHGLEMGAEVEVFESGDLKPDHVRGTTVRTPDQRVADLVIVTVQATTSVGFVTHTSRELHIGDYVRPRTESLAMR